MYTYRAITGFGIKEAQCLRTNGGSVVAVVVVVVVAAAAAAAAGVVKPTRVDTDVAAL